VAGSCEYGIEPSGSKKIFRNCWVTEQVVASEGQLCGLLVKELSGTRA
jgi:hypothetical protein